MLESGQQTVRRTSLLLAATALALIVAGGIALAATVPCTTNPCDGTSEDDVITGTEGADTINGQAGNDQVTGLNANDTLNGGAGNDRYFVTINWGSDTILDGGGNNDEIGPALDGGATAAAMPNLTVNLVSGPGPEYTDGNGNAVDWNDGAIGSVSTGAGDDVISQIPKFSNGIGGGAGNDTYKGYTSERFGGDSIGDSEGTADVLDLSSRNLVDAEFSTPRLSTSNIQGLRVNFIKMNFGCIEEFCDYVTIGRYFDNTSTDVCLSGPGPGVIETIKFADSQSVGFSQAKSLAARLDRTDNDRDGNTDEPNETCPAPPEEDTTAPTVNGTSPVNDAAGVAPTANTSATFSEDMDRSTLTTGTFTLTKQGSASPLVATVSYDGANRKATLEPASDLEANTSYTARVTGGSGGAKDLAGNALTQDHVWTFTTVAPPAGTCTITGTPNAETISGTSSDDVICAGGGNDILKGLGGNDTIKGEAGNDKLFGEAGDDTLDGGTGTNDTANFSGSLATVTASLVANTATGEGSDALSGVESLVGSPKNDALMGSEANNTISGGGGADTLDGSGGADKLTGGGGNDTEHGGFGNDSMVGSGGADNLFGDENDDTVNSMDGVNGNDSLDGGAGTDTKVTDATEKSMVGFP